MISFAGPLDVDDNNNNNNNSGEASNSIPSYEYDFAEQDPVARSAANTVNEVNAANKANAESSEYVANAANDGNLQETRFKRRGRPGKWKR